MSSSTVGPRFARMAFGSVVAVVVLAPVGVAGSSSPSGDPPAEPSADPPTLTASVSPTVIGPDGQLTYSSIDPCPEAATHVGLGYGPDGWSDTEGGIQFFHDTVPVEDDFSWSATVPGPEGVVPGLETEGRYELVARCISGREEGSEEVVHGQCSSVDFDVVAGTSTTSTTEPDRRAQHLLPGPSQLVRLPASRSTRAEVEPGDEGLADVPLQPVGQTHGLGVGPPVGVPTGVAQGSVVGLRG